MPTDTADDHELTPHELRQAADQSCIDGDLDTAQLDIAAAIDGYRESADEWGLADALAVKGSIARAAGEIDAAVRDYGESLSIFNVLGDLPSTIRLYRALGEAIFAAGDYAIMTALFLEALSLVPGDPVLLTGLGYASWYEGRIADALTYLTEALDAESGNRPALIARGQVEVEVGRPERALPDLDRALVPLAQDATTEEVDLHSARALALAQLGKTADAEAELGTAFSLQPQRAQTFLRAAQIKFLEGDAETARSLLQNALATTPPLQPGHAARARSLLELLPRLWVDNLYVTSFVGYGEGAGLLKGHGCLPVCRTLAVAERRALLIGVSGFADPADGPLVDLHFAAQTVENLSAVLRDSFGYSVTTLTDPGLTTSQLGHAVREAIVSASANDVLLLHLLTHGLARASLLYALGCDGAVDETTEVGGWLAGVQHVSGRPLVLFSLDMCHSGVVTQLPWQDSGERRGWVIAACEADRSAFDGRFTRALTTVLRELAQGDIEVGPDDEFVPIQTLARAVRSAVVAMAKTTDSYQQFVVTSRLDIAESSAAPFFPAPLLPTAATGERRPPPPELALLPYLTDDDFGSFISNAAGSAVISDLVGETIGCFSGRENELRILSRWLDRPADGPLAVVTGSPGAGKSALLGLLVCAARPALREPTTPIWRAAAVTPGAAALLCAVDARDRTLEVVAEALGRQLELASDVTPDSLLTALVELTGPAPVLVIDSLDEANDSGEVASWLISLASLSRQDGSAAARVLVGTRPYEESAELRTMAGETYSQLHDLDSVSPRVLEDDLHRYVTSLLRAIPDYRQTHQVTGAFAGKLAETLTTGNRAERGWGEFLVAGLFTRHFVSVFRRADGPGAAERMAETAPRSLSGVLDLDFDRHRDNSWLQPVLSAVAYARGNGMPASVIRRVAAALASRGPEPDAQGAFGAAPEPSSAEVMTALRIVRFYLRRSVDSEKLTVYRLFHDGLGDRLRRPEDARRVHQAILSATGPPGRRVWSAAEPYVLEHAMDYAADPAELFDDPGFLVYARRDRYLARFSERAGLLLEDVDPADSIMARRAIMARAAVESNQPSVAQYLADLPGEQPLPWLPLWVVGVPDSLRSTAAIVPAALDVRGGLRVWSQGPDSARPDRHSDVAAFALARRNGQLTIVVGDAHGAVRVIQPGGNVIPLASHDARVTALAVADYDQDLVVVSGSADGMVLVHSLSTGEQVHEPVNVRGSVSALASGGNPLDPVVACVTGMGSLSTWRIGTGQNPAPYHWTLPTRVRSAAVTAVSGRPVVLVGGEDGNARSLDCQAHTNLKVLGRHGGPVLAVAVEVIAGRATAVTGSPSGHIHKWDLLSGRETDTPVKVCSGPVATLALRATTTRLLCLVGGRGVSGTALWDLDEGRRLYDFGRNGATSVALSVDRPAVTRRRGQRHPSAVGILTLADGSAVAIIGDQDGGATGVEFGSGRVLGATVTASDDPVTSIDMTDLAGIPTAVIRSDQTVRLWQPLGPDAVLVRVGSERPGVRYSPWRDTAIVGGKLLAVTRSRTGTLSIDGDRIPDVDDVTALAVTYLDGRPVALTGDQVGLVRIWDLATRRKSDELNVGAPVFGLAATIDGRLAVGAGGRVYGFRRYGSGPGRYGPDSGGFTGQPPEA